MESRGSKNSNNCSLEVEQLDEKYLSLTLKSLGFEDSWFLEKTYISLLWDNLRKSEANVSICSQFNLVAIVETNEILKWSNL